MSTVVAKNLTVQNSAGTASANISFDGTKLVSTQPFDGLGVGQTWQDLTASRAAGVTYTNTTGKPITVCISFENGTVDISKITINGVDVLYSHEYSGWTGGAIGNFSVIVPNNATYVFSSPDDIRQWTELR